MPELLDVGAGSGVFSRQMLDAGVARRAVCVDPNYADEGMEERIAFRRSVGHIGQGLILMIDVLEHVSDDHALLRSYSDRAPSGALVLISVPAFQFLWSGHDIFLGHKRRYTLAQVEDLVRRAGLDVLCIRYFFAALFPLVVLLRWRDRWRLGRGKTRPKSAMMRQPAIANAVLTWLHSLERRSVFRFNRLGGLSVLCLARRP